MSNPVVTTENICLETLLVVLFFVSVCVSNSLISSSPLSSLGVSRIPTFLGVSWIFSPLRVLNLSQILLR